MHHLCRYNSYNRDCGTGLDYYEHDFIDDSETFKHGKKVRRESGRGKVRRKKRRNWSWIESSGTEDGEGSPIETQQTPHKRVGSRCSGSGSEDDPVIVSAHRKRRPGAQVESGSESSSSGRGGRKRKRKYRKLECDEGIRYHK